MPSRAPTDLILDPKPLSLPLPLSLGPVSVCLTRWLTVAGRQVRWYDELPDGDGADRGDLRAMEGSAPRLLPSGAI